jgi:3-O-methylgallate 3,4-dioxygenase
MAEIVFGFATSHTPMLNATPEDWLSNFGPLDQKRGHRDKDGNPVTYDELLTKADPRAAKVLNEAAVAERHAHAQAGLQKVRDELAAAKLDALIVVGDDQNEMFGTDNLPAILIYYGETISNTPRHLGGPPRPAWNQQATAAFYNDPARDYPVDAGLALHLIGCLNASGFDISSANKVTGEGEGHAVAFIHNRVMGAEPVPVVPLFLNTYYPPNQPSPARCYALGRAIGQAVEAMPGNARIGIAASGGLSHFTVDEELDRAVLEALQAKDEAALTGLPLNKLDAGSSEIRNWICAAGALEGLAMRWSDYIPGYRSPAGTGTGIAFAVWK